MQWTDLVGHAKRREWFERAAERNRLAGTFLFVGPDGCGKRTFARLIAKSLLCPNSPEGELAPCGRCPSCAQVDASTHPDLIEIAKSPDKATLPLEAIIGPPEARRSEGLCHEISLRPYSGRRKIAILDDADYLAVEGANALLKTLEEPPADSVLVLISSSLQKQLPTIRSRCRIVRFEPLRDSELAVLLQRNGYCDDRDTALDVARRSDGGLASARALTDPELSVFRSAMLERLTGRELNFIELAKAVGASTDAAGKESIVRRPRLKMLIKIAADFYRALALTSAGADVELDPDLRSGVESRMKTWSGGTEAALTCWKRSLEAIEQVDRNANQAALLEGWAAGLAAASRS